MIPIMILIPHDASTLVQSEDLESSVTRPSRMWITRSRMWIIIFIAALFGLMGLCIAYAK